MTPAAWIPPISLGAVALLAAGVWAADLDAAASRRSRSEPAPSPFIVRRLIDGEITRFEAKTGVVVVKIPAGKHTITSPQLSAASLRKGDPVSLEVAILPSALPVPPASGGQPRDRKDPAITRQRLSARVTGVDAGRGILTLQTSTGKVQIELPSDLLARFKKGDSVPVELALMPPGGASARTDAQRDRAGLAMFLLGVFGKK